MLELFERGIRIQKFFPAELAGGVDYLKAVGGPLPEVRFMPTGGITPERARDYLALSNVACVGGSWITPKQLLAAGDFKAIGKIAAQAVKL
jgi:2-dehydro-3-deoxyphosphogluconate aldolase/(4S)-4-hydroxy-2-oxoglutarate aldolase